MTVEEMEVTQDEIRPSVDYMIYPTLSQVHIQVQGEHICVTVSHLLKLVKKNNIIKYPKRTSSYWRDLAFGVGEGERNQSLAYK
jgi:hypothetical protein